MIYSQVLWALALDCIFWNVSLNAWSIIGVASVIGSLSLVSLAKEVAATRMADGIQYEQVPPGTNGSAPNIDLESLCDSEDGDEAMMDGVSHSQ